MTQVYPETHMGAEALVESVKGYAIGAKMLLIAKIITQKCE